MVADIVIPTCRSVTEWNGRMEDETASKIGAGMVIRGELSCEGSLIVAGDLEGTIVAGSITVEDEGRVCGFIQSRSIDCTGRLEGRVVTNGFTLRRGACHVGTVVTDELRVEPGAVLDCALQSGNVASKNIVEENEVAQDSLILPKLSEIIDAFTETNRPSCMDIPWSSRSMLLASVIQLLVKSKPLIRIIGEQGSGKSVFATKLTENHLESFAFLRLDSRLTSVLEFVRQIAAFLGVEGHAELGQAELLNEIRERAEKRREAGQRVVVLVDEAQQLFPATLEGITRLLTNALEEEGEELLQLVLLGTGEMQEKMVSTIHEYFEDETNCQLELDPLSIKDTAEYLRLALQQTVADGATVNLLLPYETIKAIHLKSHGNISLINRLANEAVRAASRAGVTQVGSQFV